MTGQAYAKYDGAEVQEEPFFVPDMTVFGAIATPLAVYDESTTTRGGDAGVAEETAALEQDTAAFLFHQMRQQDTLTCAIAKNKG